MRSVQAVLPFASMANKSSRYIGVSWRANKGKWQAQIRIDGRCKYLGMFDDEEAAAEAYNDAARERVGDAAILNDVTVIDPTPSQIERACERIRSGWTAQERRDRNQTQEPAMKQLRELIESEGVRYASGPARPFVPPGFSYYPQGARCDHPECIGKWTALKDGLCLRHSDVEPPRPPGRPKVSTLHPKLRKAVKRLKVYRPNN